MNKEFWKGKKVLITGHTGFKGAWLALWLRHCGARVVGISLAPAQQSLYGLANVADNIDSLYIDIRDGESLKKAFQARQPEIVLHLAAQSLVRYSYKHPVETYETNVMGTLHVLEAIRSVESVRAAVLVTTDKCYENKEWAWGYRENEPMGGFDPYSSSKGATELLIASYRNSYYPLVNYKQHKTAIASARAGNVIGGGDFAEDRLIPDMVKSFKQNKPVNIRSPHSIRPWQHVLEPLNGYLLLAEKMYVNHDCAGAWNFGPQDDDAKPVQWIVDQMVQQWGEGASWALDQEAHPHEAHYLKLDCSKAQAQLLWKPKWNLKYALQKIVEWHKAEIEGADLKTCCIDQIEEYMAL